MGIKAERIYRDPGGQKGKELEYIERMSTELARMAHGLDYKFLSYLLSMASMAARERNMSVPFANDSAPARASQKDKS